ncbi:hypothetical protein FRUB_01885 [Fimbriiglobus ruber]|uniref:Uncharacterized protein n=2 Tax=Fimbriiglobus ruber TaxID=1908690 RepID=A0A225E190_9BACT|nr:hypothetical protein FRUB_01885 [Fimbriiglobus ruber]
MEKDFKLGEFGPLEKAGRQGKFYVSTKEMGINEFANFLKAVNDKDSGKLIESVKHDHKVMEVQRVKLQAVKQLQDKFVDIQEEMKLFYPRKDLYASKAYDCIFFAKKDLDEYYSNILGNKLDAKLDSVLEKVKEAVKAFDEEVKKHPKNENAGKVKSKLVGLQGVLENITNTSVEGKGQPPKPTEQGKQSQPRRP